MSNDLRSPTAKLSKREGARFSGRSIVALGAALAAWPALAAQDYPPGLFENSPVVPSGPPGATAPSVSPDAAAPSGPADAADPDPPEALAPLDEYCAGIDSRTFRSLEEVRRAHIRCDRAHGAPPLSPPGDPFDQ
ncbi:MAG TPA: hypothetical protein VFE63_11800 [Roseiarcus sp.]|jgi:hypothetical protein|nr:hypothetical protein [Roseiarcus sp.]